MQIIEFSLTVYQVSSALPFITKMGLAHFRTITAFMELSPFTRDLVCILVFREIITSLDDFIYTAIFTNNIIHMSESILVYRIINGLYVEYDIYIANKH